MSTKTLQGFIEELYFYEPGLVTLVRSFVVARYIRYSRWTTTVYVFPISRRIPDAEFSYNFTVIHVSVPSSITHIGPSTFCCCAHLQSVVLPDSITHIGKHAFWSCCDLEDLVLPKSLISIGEGAFKFCYRLHDVSLPSTLTTLGPFAFGHSGLRSIKLPDSLVRIQAATFNHCTALEDVEFPNKLTHIDALAFQCTALKRVTFPRTLEYIDYGAFMNCPNLTARDINSSLLSLIHIRAFDYTLYEHILWHPFGVFAHLQRFFCWIVDCMQRDA